MKNIVVLGAAIGDEGKGKIVNYMSPQYDWVIRTSGGNNAGHTIYREGKKYVHNLVPSFNWFEPRTKCFLGSGMVIDLECLHNEIAQIESEAFFRSGIYSNIAKRIYVDPDAFVILPEHKEEDKLTNAHIGSTNRGIGPAYKSKVARKGTRIIDLLKSNNEWTEALKKLGVNFKHVLELSHQFERQNLLFEGAQGVLLDLNHGTYPYVSCGDSTVSGIYSCGFPKITLDKVYGVTKAYLTRVGEGPFPTEIFGEEATKLRELGKEYGATTGRPRRVGWLDLPALDYACKKGGINHLIITKCDILNGFDEVKVCAAYKKPPVAPSDFFNAEPQYITVPGWKTCSLDELMPLVNCVRNFTNCPVDYISCGVNDKDIIKL